MKLEPYKCYKSQSGRTFVYIGMIGNDWCQLMTISNYTGSYKFGDIQKCGASWKVITSLTEIEDNVEAIRLAKFLML